MRSDCPLPVPLHPRLIHLSLRDVGCLRHPLDSPEIQFTGGKRVPDFARIKLEVLLRLTKLLAKYILNRGTWSVLAKRCRIFEQIFKIVYNLTNLKNIIYIHVNLD